MPAYQYEAMGQDGRRRSGRVEAESEKQAAQVLYERNEILIRLTPAKDDPRREAGGAGRMALLMNPVSVQDIVIFSRQFSTMVRAGISAANLLTIMEEQTEHPVLKVAIGKMKEKIQQGGSFSDAFGMFPHIFSPLYCSMVHAGEVSGTLPEIMNQLIAVLEHEEMVRKDIRKALQYPKIVLASLVIAFVVLLVVVFPRFAAMYVEAGLELPLPTRICIALSDLLIEHAVVTLGVLAAIGVSVVLYLRTPAGKLRLDTLMLSLPIVGPLIQKVALSRFASIFSVMQGSGINVLESLEIIKDTIGNRAIMAEFDSLMERLSQGQGLAAPMRASRYFTPMLVNMIALGEETGNMTEMLKVVAEHYDIETKYAINRMINAIGPILTVVLAVGIGFFALAIYMPMWDLVKIVK